MTIKVDINEIMFKFGVAKLSSMLTLFFIAFILPTFVSPANLCSTSGLCCKHRDSECVAQRVYPNHTVDTSQLPCYCDHACIELEDCCPDYRQFCGGKYYWLTKKYDMNLSSPTIMEHGNVVSKILLQKPTSNHFSRPQKPQCNQYPLLKMFHF